MALNIDTSQKQPEQKKKSLLSPLLTLGGTAVGAYFGGPAGAAAGGAIGGNIGGAVEGMKKTEQTPQDQSQNVQIGNAMTRRAQSAQPDPMSTIQQGFLAAGSLPPNIQEEVLPPMIQGLSVLSRRTS